MVLMFFLLRLFQTAMINSVSQTFPGPEVGMGMGLFNLVSIISGAVRAAVVGKILDGGWLNISILHLASISKGYTYASLMIAFALIVLLGGVVYLRSYRRMPALATLKQEASDS